VVVGALPSAEPPTWNLGQCPVGSPLRIVRVAGGHGLRRRLGEMGLLPGETVRVAVAGGRGPVILEVKGSKIALGAGMARHIFARPA